jgi:hypothetical protein
MLRAIFGGTEKPEAKHSLASKVSSLMASLGARKVKRGE